MREAHIQAPITSMTATSFLPIKVLSFWMKSPTSPYLPSVNSSVLEEKKMHPVGSEKYIGVDVRVIAASNVDLNKEAAGEKFRPDLYHRLKEFYIYLPPLRERKDDIFFLAERFIQETSIELGRNAPKLSSEAAECILKHRWPGNVRELRNTIRSSVLMADTAIKIEYLHIESSRYPLEQDEDL